MIMSNTGSDVKTIEADASLYIYAVTIKKNNNPDNNKETLEKELKAVARKFNGFIKDYTFEYGQNNIIHIHGVLCCPNQIFKCERIKRRGWSNDLAPAKNIDAWIKYIYKDQNNYVMSHGIYK